jgi:hypothetical protein
MKRVQQLLDGSFQEIWTEPIRTEMGEITSFIEISRDITDRINYEN